jgi:hypothetical protein
MRGSTPPQSGFNQVSREGDTIGGGPIMGVVSRSTETSLRILNGRNKYNEWPFVPTAATTQAGAGGNGTQTPGGRGTQAPGLGRGQGSTAAPGLGGRGLPRGGSGMSSPLQLPGRGGR